MVVASKQLFHNCGNIKMDSTRANVRPVVIYGYFGVYVNRPLLKETHQRTGAFTVHINAVVPTKVTKGDLNSIVLKRVGLNKT